MSVVETQFEALDVPQPFMHSCVAGGTLAHLPIIDYTQIRPEVALNFVPKLGHEKVELCWSCWLSNIVYVISCIH